MTMGACMNINQAEIWLVSFNPTTGQEIGKKRPAIVVSSDQVGKLKLRTVVPVTDWKDAYVNYPWMIKINPNTENNLSKESAIDCFQVKSLSTDRFIQKIGDVKNIFDIHSTIAKTFNPLYRLK
jgi:mRNA interferase MazF